MEKKILIISNSGGGLFSFRKELMETLVKQHQVVIAAPDSDRTEYFRSLGCTFLTYDLERHGTNPLQELKLISFYKKLIKREAPDIVLTYTIKPNVYAGMACASLKVPYVANITGLGTAVENAGIMQRITLALHKWGLRKAQKVFFQNAENQAFMTGRKVITGEYDLLPGSGVNLERFSLQVYPQDDTVNFFFISRIMKQKGVDQYLEAAEYIRRKYPYTRFHVCGGCEQNYTEKLQQLHEKEVIIYHGRVNDVPKMHQISHCTIHPTYYPEGMSNVLLESAACGRPIITTNRSGCREIVDDGVNGFVVRQQDTQDLIEKIEKFLALPWESRKAMGLAGRKKVEREFDRNIVIEKYLREINKEV